MINNAIMIRNVFDDCFIVILYNNININNIAMPTAMILAQYRDNYHILEVVVLVPTYTQRMWQSVL